MGRQFFSSSPVVSPFCEMVCSYMVVSDVTGVDVGLVALCLLKEAKSFPSSESFKLENKQ